MPAHVAEQGKHEQHDAAVEQATADCDRQGSRICRIGEQMRGNDQGKWHRQGQQHGHQQRMQGQGEAITSRADGFGQVFKPGQQSLAQAEQDQDHAARSQIPPRPRVP
jgi:hypothetical protein